MTAIVHLALAVICFQGRCYPALVGNSTPTGTFAVHRVRIPEPGYGGDALVFKEDATYIWAIHRLWLGRPSEHRAWRLAHGQAADRHITFGCINVSNDVYEKLVAIDHVEITP